MNNMHEILSDAKICSTVVTGAYTSVSEFESAVATLEADHHELLAVLWFENTVTTAYVDRGLHCAPAASVEMDHLIEARVFNADVELHVWRISSGSYGWRLRTDGAGSEVETLTSRQYLWGTKVTPCSNRWSMISEDRGFSLSVPFDVPAGTVDARHRLAVIIRSYIGFNGDHQAGYVDDRFVDFTAFAAGTDHEVILNRGEGRI